ncbi:MAG TPA: GNAT family N-acetyltransferase [Gaiellaceae bacterium]|nr:GNAT family N-acetyltransferase [Gaiellaceae bacterium]
MEIRTATGSDAEAVERIRVRGWQTAYRHVFPPDELDQLQADWSRWQRRFETPPAGWAIFVAETDEGVVGFVAVGPSRDRTPGGELYAIYVDPDSWSTGVGRALIARAEERLAEEYDEATLWVLDENPRARRFYEAAGWAPDGASKREERLGVAALEVRYYKRLSKSASRS